MSPKLTQRYFLKLMMGNTATVGLSAVGGVAYTTLTPLTASGGVLTCLRNHDHWTNADTVAGTQRDAGITVLRKARGGRWGVGGGSGRRMGNARQPG
ncbi:MAG: hypothetical protein GY832_10890 [Chloroflexi bacterium]|nr:hypothetical protein [Chloroflexota bacterium]